MNDETNNELPSWDPYTAVPNDAATEDVRSLAAILFTDVVGFSKMTSQNEARVYVAVQRDMGIIQKLCRAHNGEVLNTMGDGMLMAFDSAVSAMTCALEIQRTLYVQAKTLPPQEVLHHRMGVHLGDIIRRGTNVFGEGVNISARLQAKSKPDGICFSQMVHEVIKSKMKVDAKYTGQQMLKNIPDPVKIWEVAPIREAGTIDIAMPSTRHSDIPSGAIGLRAISLYFVASVILVVGGWGIVALVKQTKIPPPSERSTPNMARGKKESNTAVVDKPSNAVEANAKPPDTPPSTNVPPPPKDTSSADVAKTFLGKYDFDGAVVALTQKGFDKTADGQSLIQKIQNIKLMWVWMVDEISGTALDKPLNVNLQSPSGQMVPAKLYQGGKGIMVDAGTGPVENRLTDFRPASILSVASELAVKPVKQPNPSASMMISAFAELYGLKQ